MSLTLPPLPYALDALEPHISRRTLAAHHGYHHAAHVEKTRALVRRTPLESASLEDIVAPVPSRRPALFSTRRPKHGTTHSIGAACARAEEARHTGQSRS